MKEYKAIGLMSGTSLDGLDMALVRFVQQHGKWSFELLKSDTISYNSFWRDNLETAQKWDGESLHKLHIDYGHFLGKAVSKFIMKTEIQPDLVASHGHTVFHNPNQGYTLQIGSGSAIASHLGCKVVFDFRSEDVALGGQGAPLVPIGDELLFGDYTACINLGGFANISTKANHQRIAWDIGPANFILNPIAQNLGYKYDNNGDMARKGSVNEALLGVLNNLDYYKLSSPKSIGREWVENIFEPAIEPFILENHDLLRTFIEHISDQISRMIKGLKGQILFTGGGAKNSFLMERIASKSGADIYIPKEEIVDFKEAIIFAFMGVLRVENQLNILSSVTGARRSSSAGSIVGGKK